MVDNEELSWLSEIPASSDDIAVCADFEFAC
jgi:hypothetical protein